MNLDQPAILGIVFGALIGGVHAALQIVELRQRNRTMQLKGVGVLIPGAVGRLLFVVVAWWLAIRFAGADFGRYLYCAALGAVERVHFPEKVIGEAS